MDRSQACAFALASLLLYTASFTVAYVCGRLVERYGFKVNYTRKIGHFVIIGLPWFLQQALSLDRNLLAVVLAAIVTPMSLALYVKPIRSRVPIVATMFRSFDRPEDRPHTLSWLLTQYLAVFAVYLGIYAILLERNVIAWMIIPIVVNIIGDGLAEPVGVAFGKHSYRCRALFSGRTYVRTWEGSACVFVSGLAAVWFCRSDFSPLQFYLALGLIPLSAALAEAFSPHTWDAPFLFLVVGGELILLSFL